jgi:hypothetical protein
VGYWEASPIPAGGEHGVVGQLSDSTLRNVVRVLTTV